MSSPVVRWQLITPSPDKSAAFYEKVFGWKISQNNALGYREIDTGGLAGGMWPAPPQASPFVQLFVAVSDVDACLAAAERHGAKVVVQKTVLPDGDTMAVIADPSGLSVGVCLLK